MTANAIAMRWSAARVDPAALEPAARDDEVGTLGGGVPPEIADALGDDR